MRKGQAVAFIWIFALLMIFIVGLLYVVMSKPFDKVATAIEDDLDAQSRSTFDKVKNYWFAWPLIFVPAVLMWMYVRSLSSQEPGQYY